MTEEGLKINKEKLQAVLVDKAYEIQPMVSGLHVLCKASWNILLNDY